MASLVTTVLSSDKNARGFICLHCFVRVHGTMQGKLALSSIGGAKIAGLLHGTQVGDKTAEKTQDWLPGSKTRRLNTINNHRPTWASYTHLLSLQPIYI
jgi:hypothetical protein